MHLSRTRGARLLLVMLMLAALAGGLILPVTGAEERETASAAVSPGVSPPDPLGSGTSTPVAGTTTKAVTATKTTPPPTTRASTPTTTATTAPPTQKTSAPTTTASRTDAPTTVRTTSVATTLAPTYEVPSMPAAVTVVTAPPVVGGAYTVPAGTGVFTITSVGNVPVGGDGVVQLIVDNGWSPLFSDTYIDVSWDPTMVSYRSGAIKVLNTTAAVSSDHSVRVMLGDFRRGYPQGRYPLAAITLRALREGTSTLTVSVDHVRYWSSDFSEFTDITATASARNGIFSTGALPVETQPLVTFTQNTLAPASYPANDIDPGAAATVTTTRETATATTTIPTTTASTTTLATAAPATATTTGSPSETLAPTPEVNGTYAPVSTRVQGSGYAVAGAVATTLGVLGAAALSARRRG